MKRITILLTLFVIAQSAMAYKYHDPKGGADHSHHNYDPAQARTWKFEDKRIAAEGTFLMAKAGKVFIEKKDGVVSFSIEKLSWVDQKYVTRKLKEIEEINSQRYLDRPAKKATNTSQWAQTLAGLVLVLTLVFTAVLLRQKTGKPSLVVSSFSALLMASLVLASCANADVGTDEPPSIGTSFTSDPTVMDAVFTPYSNVSTRWDAEELPAAGLLLDNSLSK